MQEVKPVKDPDHQTPVPTDWRPIFEGIVRAFSTGEYFIKRDLLQVKPISDDTAKQVKGYLENYGEKLVEINQAAWNTSVSLWTEGYWEVLVDLWTAESGPSDLVLSARVFEEDGSFCIEVMGVYVP